MTARFCGRGGRALRRLGEVSALMLLAVLSAPGVGEACAVCFGAEDSPMTAGMNNGILTLLSVIGAVQVGFIGLFVGFWRRSRRMRRRKTASS